LIFYIFEREILERLRFFKFTIFQLYLGMCKSSNRPSKASNRRRSTAPANVGAGGSIQSGTSASTATTMVRQPQQPTSQSQPHSPTFPNARQSSIAQAQGIRHHFALKHDFNIMI
jgi:hypothetical protein